MGYDPFEEILNIVDGEVNSRDIPCLRLGRVLATTPLTIECGGLSFSGNSVKTNAMLLREPFLLKISDTVLLFPLANYDQFVVICKIV